MVPISRDIMGVYLTGVHLIGMYLINVHLTGVPQACISWACTSWACIDQANTQERNHQVTHMAEIYRGARRAIYWLERDLDDQCSLRLTSAPFEPG
jgi:hypothetical protein